MTSTSRTQADGRGEASSGLRERKKAATRRAIKATALELADRDGLESLTVAAISERAGVSQRTFFNYFSCKEQALVGENLEFAGHLREQVLARPEHERPLQVLRTAFTESSLLDPGPQQRAETRAHQRLVRDHPELLPWQLSKYETYERSLRDAMAQRLGTSPEDDARPGLVAALGTTVLRLSVQRWTADERRSLREHLTETFDLLDGGL